MAADGSITLLTKVDQKGLNAGIKGITSKMNGLASTVAKTFAAIGIAKFVKDVVEAYSEFEQLEGGVQKIFDKANISQIMNDANNAFLELGMSANDYLRTMNDIGATFSATMGDQKGYDTARQGLLAISDYASGTGKNVDVLSEKFAMITRSASSYQSIADQFSGILPATSADFLAQAKAAGILSNKYTKLTEVPIAEYQQAVSKMLAKGVTELGLTGNTAAEAASTISGSLGMLKAAWSNVLVGIASDGDFEQAMNNLVYSISAVFDNLSPVIQRSLVGIGQLIEKVAPMLVQNVAMALIQSIPSLLNAIYQMIIGLAKGIYEGIKALFTGSKSTITAQLNTSMGEASTATDEATESMDGLTEATEEAGKAAKKSLAGFDDLQILADNSSAGGAAETPAVDVGGGAGGIESVFSTDAVKEAEPEVSGFVSVLQEQFAKIAEMASQIWNSEPVQAFVSAATITLTTYWDFLKTMWSDIGTNGITTWGNIQSDLQTMLTNMTTLWTLFWQDFGVAVETWGQPLIDSISTLFNSIWQTAIDPAIQLITGMWSDFSGILVSLWEEHGAPLLNNLGEFANQTVALFQSIYDNVLEPIITPFLEMLSWLWDEHLSKLVYAVGDFVMSLVNGALEIYNKFIVPIVTDMLEKFAPVWSFISELVIGVAGSLIGYVVDLATGLIKTLTGIVDFIVGVFTGNWEKAWDGIKGIFTGIWEALEGSIKGVINIIIDVLNSLVAGINKISFDVPEWVPVIGGKKWGFEIPKIPKLAQGAVIPPNREFLAVLGDQKHGTNIEAPAELIKQMVREAMNESNGSGSTTVVLEIDGREFGHAVIEQGQRESKRLGTRLVMA